MGKKVFDYCNRCGGETPVEDITWIDDEPFCPSCTDFEMEIREIDESDVKGRCRRSG